MEISQKVDLDYMEADSFGGLKISLREKKKLAKVLALKSLESLDQVTQ